MKNLQIWVLVLLVVIVAVVVRVTPRREAGDDADGDVDAVLDATGMVGQLLPPLTAEGWLNGAPPVAEDLRGKVLVIDCFATW